jgi:hypothetical protein
VQLLRLAAVVLFVLAALGGFGWGLHLGLLAVLGLLAAGYACVVASSLTIPSPPPR